MGILSAYTLYSEYINSETMTDESYNTFRNETDKSTIVRLKCPS